MSKPSDLIGAIYSRKSKFSDKGESVENQVQLCEEYGRKLGINKFIVYEDEGFSGKNTERPQFKKMMKEANSKKFSTLICYRLDRISRNVLDFSNTIEELNKLDISFVSIREQFDTTTPMGRAMMYIASVFAQLERETIAERIKDNMIELSKTGRWLGGTPPLGFKSELVNYLNSEGKSKKMHRLANIDEEIPIIELIYHLFIEKESFTTVATYLCKNEYIGKNGGEFSRETVKQIISNPVYCMSDEKVFNWFKQEGATICGVPDGIHGLMVYNKREGGKKAKGISEWIIAVGEHKGIISSERWLQCQEIIEKNKEKSSPRSGTGDKFLLSGMIVCGECSSGMASWSHFNSKRDFMERYYRCNLRNRASNRCSNKMLNAYKAEEYVVDNLKNLNLEQLISAYSKNQNKIYSKGISKNEIESLSKAREENEKIIRGLMKRIAIAELEENNKLVKDYEKEIETLKAENYNIGDKISNLELKIQTEEESELFIETISNYLDNFKKFYDLVDTGNKRRLIKNLVESIVWYGETENIEINLIGSNKMLPNGKVRRRV